MNKRSSYNQPYKGVMLGSIRLEQKVGEGATGEVWVGEHQEAQLPVAIKILHPAQASSEHFIDMFHNEAQAVMQLSHPNVIELYDFGVTHQFGGGEPTLYLAMEYAQHGSLDRVKRKLGWEHIRTILLLVLDGLAHAHSRGVIHRDLKPQNILLGCGPQGTVKVTDFGLAHAMMWDPHHSGMKTRQLAEMAGWGTPQYMAPEQFRGQWRDYGPWTDLYAIGCMAYELLTGAPPYGKEDRFDMARLHMTAELPRVMSELGLPQGVEGWVHRLLQKEPEHRFQFAADAALGLRELEDPDQTSRMLDPLSHEVLTTLSSHFDPQHKVSLATGRSKEFAREIVEDSGGFEAGEVPPKIKRPVEDLDDTQEVRLEPSLITTAQLPLSWRMPHEQAEGRAETFFTRRGGRGFYGVRSPRFVGREMERDILWEMLRDVCIHGRMRVALIHGEAGVGKSRLVRWLCQRAHMLGCANVLEMHYSNPAGMFDGFGPMLSHQMRLTGLEPEKIPGRIEEHLRRVGMTRGREVDLFVRLFVEDAHQDERDQMDAIREGLSEQHRFELFANYLQEMTHDRPVVVHIDDLHYGEEAGAFLNYLIQSKRLLTSPVLFLATVADGSPQAPSVEVLLEHVEHEPHVFFSCPIFALEEEEICAIVKDQLGDYVQPEVHDAIVERAVGMPLVALQWAEQVMSEQVAKATSTEQQDEDQTKLNESPLYTLWTTRLEHVKHHRPEAWRMLEVAAVLGQHVSSQVWRRFAQHEGVEWLIREVDALVRMGFVKRTVHGWSFVHRLLHVALVRFIKESEGRWQGLNERAAKLWTVWFPEDFERLGGFLLETGRDVEALEVMRQRVMQLMHHGEYGQMHQTLIERGRRVSRIYPNGASKEHVQNEVLWGRWLNIKGRYLEAEQRVLEALNMAWNKGWRLEYKDAVIQHVYAMLSRGGAKEALARLDALLVQFDGEFAKMPQALPIEMLRARAYLTMGQRVRAKALFKEMYQWSVRGHDVGMMALCLNGLGDVARQQHQWNKAKEYAWGCLEMAKESGDLLLEADCLDDLAELYRFEGDLAQARELAMEALELLEVVDAKQARLVRLNMACIECEQSKYDVAWPLLKELEQSFEASSDQAPLARVKASLALCHANSEEWELMLMHLQQMSSLIQSTGLVDHNVGVVLERIATLGEASGQGELVSWLQGAATLHQGMVRGG